MKRILSLSIVTLALLGTCACSNTHMSNADIGMVTGAVAGGVIGSQFGGGAGKVATTIGGTLVGGYVGRQVGKSWNNNN